MARRDKIERVAKQVVGILSRSRRGKCIAALAGKIPALQDVKMREVIDVISSLGGEITYSRAPGAGYLLYRLEKVPEGWEHWADKKGEEMKGRPTLADGFYTDGSSLDLSTKMVMMKDELAKRLGKSKSKQSPRVVLPASLTELIVELLDDARMEIAKLQQGIMPAEEKDEKAS